MAALACGAIPVGLMTGCDAGRRGRAAGEAARVYPPVPQAPRVVALGNLPTGASPSAAQVQLALFLFGEQPPAAPLLANPTAIAVQGEDLLVCDGTLGVVFRARLSDGDLCEMTFSPPLAQPFALDAAPNGDLLVCDRGGVRRWDAAGRPICAYTCEGTKFRPAGVLAVGNDVWVTNLAAHRIEVFDYASGQHRRFIGQHGEEPGQFALPRSLARGPDGSVYVVDVLNTRVQVLDPQGRFVRSIGQAGDNVGCFGRPKDVAVGPDGTVFVTDVFSQRVHTFGPDGGPLLAFGEPGSGLGGLRLPNGIAVTMTRPRSEYPLTADTAPVYYVLVAEQLHRPGVRVYAWLGGQQEPLLGSLPSGEALDWRPTFPGSTVINPHWDATRCTACHQSEGGGQMLPIALEATDGLCLSCHDGVKAPADPHPIGRPGITDLVKTPADWPMPNGSIGCMTCHDIKRHCSPEARRPTVNPVLLRGFDPQRPLEYCTICHTPDVGGRFSPHRQRDATGRVRDDACFFCHTQRPELPADGRRRFQPHLRVETSALCLNCHSRHWDLSTRGHVDRPVTPKIREWMLTRELSLTVVADRRQLEALAADPNRHPARLPLGNNMVTCYTCHNPHYAGLFRQDSELGALAKNPQDRRSALRTDWIDLCSECHNR